MRSRRALPRLLGFAWPRSLDEAGEREVVSIVFADLAGSTVLHERLDAETARAFMDHYYRAMQGSVETEGGRVTQLLGNGVKAVFGAPLVAEGDALRVGERATLLLARCINCARNSLESKRIPGLLAPKLVFGIPFPPNGIRHPHRIRDCR